MKCPICGEQTGHANNHVRMTDGDGHGPMSSYPDGWDTDDPAAFEPANVEADTDETEKNEQSENASDVEIDPNDESGDGDREELAELTFADDEADASEYECGECSEPLQYLGGKDADGGGKECPNCGEALYWSMM